MTITSGSLRGENPRKKPKKVSPETRKALALLKSIDTGMTLTRFQIEAAGKLAVEDNGDEDVDSLIRAALYALSSVETDDNNDDIARWLGIALESIVVAVDMLDKDVEDVARRTLDEL